MLLEGREDVLEKVELLVAGRCPEIVAVDDQRFLLLAELMWAGRVRGLGSLVKRGIMNVGEHMSLVTREAMNLFCT